MRSEKHPEGDLLDPLMAEMWSVRETAVMEDSQIFGLSS